MRRIVAMCLSGLMVSGCVWMGYEPPSEQSFRTAGAQGRCPRVGVQNLDAERAAIILAATAEACRIITSDEFKRRLASESLRERCASPARIRGAELHRLLLTGLPDFSVVARKPFLAQAVADVRLNRISVRKSRFAKWANDTDRGALINTLVHEWTHLIPTDGYSRFQDEGHNDRTCPDSSLVSYHTGDIAEDVWTAIRNG